MNLSFLPKDMYSALRNLNENFISEIRIKTGQPVIILYKREYKYLTRYSLSDTADGAIICKNVGDVLAAATENSVYVYSEQLKKGYITKDGLRIGVAGKYVTDGNKVISLKEATSLNIRIPHRADGCSHEIFKFISQNGLKSTIIFSPPGFGKTTILRELSLLISEKLKLNVLICDEREELFYGDLRESGLGDRCDVVTGACKAFAFENVVRAMTPQVIVTDEIYGEDMQAIKFLSECGITFLASSHLTDESVLKNIPAEYFIKLSGVGCMAEVYDKNFNIVCNCNTLCNDWRDTV